MVSTIQNNYHKTLPEDFDMSLKWNIKKKKPTKKQQKTLKQLHKNGNINVI